MNKELFDSLVESMHEMVAIKTGELQPHERHVHRHQLPDVKKLRVQVGLKQAEFAEAVGVSAGLVQSWEQQRRIPSGSSLKLLMMIEKNPALIEVLRAL